MNQFRRINREANARVLREYTDAEVDDHEFSS